MDSKRFDTSELPAAQQYEAWLSWFDRVFNVKPAVPYEQGFLARSEMWTLDGCALSRVDAPSISVTRNTPLIRRNPIDPWVITIGRSVTTAVTTRGRHFDAAPGVPFVVSLGSELVSQRDTDGRLHLYLFRDDFSHIAPILDAACGASVDGAMGALLSDYLLLLERRLPDVAAEDLPRLRDAIGAMVAACVAPTPDKLAVASDQIDLSRLEKVRFAVRKHLRSPSLGPRVLCRHIGTSRSQLYRLLEAEGGVARYIQRQRLLAAYAILSDPAHDKSIAAIAEEFCFADASGFSRAFRQEFDMSPSDLRAAGRAGVRPVLKMPDHADVGGATLHDLLRVA
jgi:AraC-like DNA-binding protein